MSRNIHEQRFLLQFMNKRFLLGSKNQKPKPYFGALGRKRFGHYWQESCIIGFSYSSQPTTLFKILTTILLPTSYQKKLNLELKFWPQQNYIAQIPNFQSPPLHLTFSHTLTQALSGLIVLSFPNPSQNAQISSILWQRELPF